MDPAWTGNGIRLLQATEEQVRQVHGRLLIVETSSKLDYENTRQFYMKNDYLLEETIRDFYREGEHRMTYLKRLGKIRFLDQIMHIHLPDHRVDHYL